MSRPNEELIFDRTEEDLINKTSKGKYEYTDLNRIEEWCQYIAEFLDIYSYHAYVEIKTDWTRLDMPTVSEIERIRQNVLSLKNAYFTFTQVPNNLNFMTIEKANDIEKILNEIETLIHNMEQYFVYSGVAGSGQNRMWQQRFRRKYFVPSGYVSFIDANGEKIITSDNLEFMVKE